MQYDEDDAQPAQEIDALNATLFSRNDGRHLESLNEHAADTKNQRLHPARRSRTKDKVKTINLKHGGNGG